LNWVEIVGYVGSVVIAISLSMGDVLRLRVINMVGASIFASYGFLVDAYPVAALNSFIVLVNIYHLGRMWRDRSYFEILDVTDSPTTYLQRFLEVHGKEIAELAPKFNVEHLAESRVLFILRDLAPAGLVVWTDGGEGTVRLDLDFAAAPYRDLRCGRWFFKEREEWFAARGFKRFVTHTPQVKHSHYLRAVGFVRDAQRGPGYYQRPITSS